METNFEKKDVERAFHKIVAWIAHENRKILAAEKAIQYRVMALEQLARALIEPNPEQDKALAVAMGISNDIIEQTEHQPAAGLIIVGNGEQIGSMISLERVEELHIKTVLARNLPFTKAAKVLGMARASLERKRKKYGLMPERTDK